LREQAVFLFKFLLKNTMFKPANNSQYILVITGQGNRVKWANAPKGFTGR